MLNNYIKYSLISFLFLFFFSCKKKAKVVVDPVPTIELVSINPSTVTEFKDSISITIKYKDANGDLGDDNPDELSLEIKDSRLSKADYYHVKPLAPNTGKDIPIEGELRVKLNSMFLLGTGTKETVTLNIKFKDRAGNWSNEVVSSPITINK
jgi:hypothetical protein